MSYHFFQIAQMVAFPDALAEGGFNPNDMLAFLPTLFLFIYILFPGNFVTSVTMTIIFLFTFIPPLMQVQGCTYLCMDIFTTCAINFINI